MNQLKIMCYMSEFLFLHNIFMLKSYFFKLEWLLKTLIIITKSLSIQANKKCTQNYAVSQKESDPSYFYLDSDKT